MNEEVNAELVAKLIGDERAADSVPVVLRFPILRLSQEFIEDNTFDEGVGAMLRSMVQDSLVDGLEVFPYRRSGDTV